MLALLEMLLVPLPAMMLPLTVYVALAPEGRLTPALMLPLPGAVTHLPPFDPAQVQVTPVSCAGIVSVTIALLTAVGPLLVATMVYVFAWPQAIPPMPSVLVIAR